MKTFPTVLLLVVAPAVTAQEVLVPEDSMRDAWHEEQEEFESLSRDQYGYDSDLDRDYASPGTEQRRQRDWQSTTDDTDLDNSTDGLSLDEEDETEIESR